MHTLPGTPPDLSKVCTSSSLPELEPELLDCAAVERGVGLGRLACAFSACVRQERQCYSYNKCAVH